MALRRLSCLLLTVLAVACGQREDAMLLGSWRAVDVREGADSLRLNPAEIGFTFHEDNRYDYRSTLKYREAGTWRYENGYLYAQDTTGQSSEQYIVAVDLLTPDSLQLRMRGDSAERRVLLLRE